MDIAPDVYKIALENKKNLLEHLQRLLDFEKEIPESRADYLLNGSNFMSLEFKQCYDKIGNFIRNTVLEECKKEIKDTNDMINILNSHIEKLNDYFRNRDNEFS